MGMKRIVQIITQIDGGNLEYKDGLASSGDEPRSNLSSSLFSFKQKV